MRSRSVSHSVAPFMSSSPSFAPLRAVFLADEARALEPLLAVANLSPAEAAAVDNTARQLVNAVRTRQRSHAGMQSFLTQYDLSSQEGVLLMCVAEALLRIPDAATADKLIKDKFAQGDWARHLGQSDSLLVNAGTWGMMLTGKLVSVEPSDFADVTGWLGKMANRAGEPIVRAALRQGMKLMAEQFVMGRTIEDALQRSDSGDNARYRHSFDMLGEAAMTMADAERYFVAYRDAIKAIGGYVKPGQGVFEAPGISVKLSALHPRYEFAQRERVMKEMLPRVMALTEMARDAGIGLTLDAEETERLEISLELLAAVFGDARFHGYEGLGLAVQAYQKRAPAVIDWLIQLSEQHGRRIMTRLVKGAYWDTEIKRAQMQGFPEYPVFTRKVNTDVSYLACAAKMLARPDAFYCQFATHNAHTVATILTRASAQSRFEFQRLHGMGAELYDELPGTPAPACRVYAPVGSHEDLLPYLVRRLLENGANSSFVNRIADPDVSIDDVVADPVAACCANVSKANARLPLPIKLFDEADVSRINSSGFSFADAAALDALQAGMAAHLTKRDWQAAPLIAGQTMRGVALEAVDPVYLEKIGVVEEADDQLVDLALKIARDCVPPAAAERAAMLERAADLLEERRGMFMALMVREAGKTQPDALGEVREAADFCRYYAALCRRHFSGPEVLPGPTGESNELTLTGRGVFVAISPWNFPLAIFLGQVAAAYAAGNAVIAKPAEQTPIIAYETVKLLLEAGMPPDAIALLPGPGETVGARLVNDARIDGVVFTGGTNTAQAINKSLAARAGAIIPFIAETGGLNAMIADSSALPEQVVNDVIASAFNSAGQRCSALRILCVQKDIAPRIAKLLEGAMQELRLGDPARIETDIGPVIDREALAMLVAHREKMAAQFPTVGQTALPRDIPPGHFFAPCAFEIPRFETIQREVFGPILHILPFEGEKLMELVDTINASGYGLTLGIHSRIEETIAAVRARARVGNVYVNRNQIGAVVGVQPFGGEGLSGTGPKAGGPHYLFRFASERTFTVNTAAAGGNAALIASSE
ncbi:MAG: bifunctional proline dehydrogenase/L-glutamate gamma-semialdehyde dehydrogenase PutA [Betaproteobacteria bacterium]|nr:bifunctional proline dehydrogenase/L-glutamate gamma-semialdehyde dehydrogenase PutA [Betaproteobacteria bacterium]